jgi:hypothetical protein
MKKYPDALSRTDVDKNNFRLFVIDGILFKTGFQCVDAFTIVSVFIHSLTGSVVLAGFAQFIQTFFMQLGRFVKAPRVHAIKKQHLYICKVNTIAKSLWILLSVIIFLDVPQSIILPLLFIALAVSWYMSGMTGPVFEDLLVRTILPRRRSELLGYREVFGGIAAFLASLVAKAIIGSNIIINSKFAILFLIGGIFMASSAAPLSLLKDPYHKVDNNPASLFSVLKSTGKVLKQQINYKWYLVVKSIWVITDCALLLTIVAVKSVGNLNDVTVSYMIIAQVVGGLCGGVLWGKMAKIQGSRFAIIIVQMIKAILALIMIFILRLDNVTNFVYILIIFFIGLSLPSALVTFVYFSEITPDQLRPKFMAIQTSITMPLAFASYLFGLIADKAGFTSIYTISVVGATAILLIAITKLLKPNEISAINP